MSFSFVFINRATHSVYVTTGAAITLSYLAPLFHQVSQTQYISNRIYLLEEKELFEKC